MLLLGGAGTLAFWTAESSMDLGIIKTGELKLAVGSCSDWQLDGSGSFDPATDAIVPGDTLTRTCEFEVTAVGEHLEATVGLTGGDGVVISGGNPDGSGADLTTSASFGIGTSAPGAPILSGGSITEDNDGDSLFAAITVELPAGANDTANGENGNGTQALTATLDTIAVTLTQVHT